MDPVASLRSMPVRRQMVLALAIFALFCAGMASIYFVFLRQPDGVLFSKLRPLDAATIVAELDKRKVRYHLADGGTTILMPRSQVDGTRLSLLSQDLPLKGAVGFELFNKSDIGLTEFEQRINYQRALQGELARTIMALDAIDTARVHLSLPEPTIFRDDRRAPKASIAVTLKPGKALTDGAVAGIQKLVADAVPDLDAGNVVVIDGEGQVISPDAPPQAPAESSAQTTAETYYAAVIRRALSLTYPGEDFSVKVSAVPVAVADSNDSESAPDAADDPFTDWTPQHRRFPLKVEIVTPMAATAQAGKNIRVAAQAAVADDPNLGDEIIVTLPAPAPPESFSAAGTAVSAPEGTGAGKPLMPGTRPDLKAGGYAFWLPVLLVALIGLTFSGSQLLRHMRRPRVLSETERRRFASRFQTLLEQGGVDATETR